MFDKTFILNCLGKIEETILHIKDRTKDINSVEDFSKSPRGVDMLDVATVRLEAIGEVIKNIDKNSSGVLLLKYKNFPWRKIMKMKYVIGHHYFDIDEEAIFNVIKNDLNVLLTTIRNMKEDAMLK